MKLSWWKALGGFFLAAGLSLPALGNTVPALPGTLNYIEGQASIQNQPLTPQSVGSVDLESGQTLTTHNGRAEILLTPGVFLRLDQNSQATMISPSLTNTEVQLDRGHAEVEVAEIHDQNNLQMVQGDATTRMIKKGLYAFSAQPDTVQVLKGQARVFDGDQTVKVNGGHELNLDNTARLKARKFNKDRAKQSDFYQWSKLRSKYLSEASENAAQVYVGNGWVGSGWYWDPWLAGYTFVPGAGILYSPFGWGFYSPGVLDPYAFYGPPIVRFHDHDGEGAFHRFREDAPREFPHEGMEAHEFHEGGRFGGFHEGEHIGGFHDGGQMGGFHRGDRH